jgi:hypothetical protein
MVHFLAYFPYFETRRSGKREKRKKMGGGSERHYIGGGRGQETISPVLKVPRQCPLVLLV